MTLKLRPESSPPSPFTWDIPQPSPPEPSSLPSPPAAWLSAKDMKLYGSRPLTSTSDIGVVKCKDCSKPILRSFVSEHATICAKIRSASLKNGKLKVDADDKKNAKKRKASPTPPEDPSEPQKKKAKPQPKVNKGRVKGPIDYDKQCGVINDKNLPCSRSLTCKSHSMGAKRAVQGRSRPYDELLLEWNRANNPNFVEPVKRETKAEKKEKREREKLEKKRLEAEAAAARGVDVTATSSHKKNNTGVAKKFGKKAAAAAAAAVRLAGELGGDVSDDLAEIDSEAELDDLVKVVNISIDGGTMAVPLAVPYDAGSWFVQRRERARVCRDLLNGALNGGSNNGVPGTIGALNIARSTSIGHSTMHR